MKFKYIVLIFVIGLISYGLFFYFKPSKSLNKSVSIDRIVIIKHKHRLDLISNDMIIQSYAISLGQVSNGPKEYEGDKKTPEGLYFINEKNPNSRYHKNLGISYPNKKDIEHANSIGKKPGELIKIHGIKNGFGWIGRFHLLFDWTAGCIAMTNKEVDELYDIIKIGTPIEIKR